MSNSLLIRRALAAAAALLVTGGLMVSFAAYASAEDDDVDSVTAIMDAANDAADAISALDDDEDSAGGKGAAADGIEETPIEGMILDGEEQPAPPPLPSMYQNDPRYADELRSNSISDTEPLPEGWARAWSEEIGDIHYSYIESTDGSWVVWVCDTATETFISMGNDQEELVQTPEDRAAAIETAGQQMAADTAAFFAEQR